MKPSRQQVARAVEQPDSSTRLYLFYGPDEAQSRAFGARLAEALAAEKFVVPGGAIKSDPAALVDEAGAMSLFGGRRVIWVEPAGDEITAGAAALLEAPSVESPVIAIGGALRKTSTLVKLAEASAGALAFASYVPEGAEAARMVADVGRRFGLKIDQGLAARVADAAGNDQAIVSQELQKLALYIDASPQSPKVLDRDAVEAVGAELVEGETTHLPDLALSGRLDELAEELSRLSAGAEAIPIVRALQRRLLMLAPARARVERGESAGAVMTSLGRSLFWKDKPLVERLLTSWDAKGLATVAERAGALERSLIFSDAPAQEALGEELLSIARAARSRR